MEQPNAWSPTSATSSDHSTQNNAQLSITTEVTTTTYIAIPVSSATSGSTRRIDTRIRPDRMTWMTVRHPQALRSGCHESTSRPVFTRTPRRDANRRATPNTCERHNMTLPIVLVHGLWLTPRSWEAGRHASKSAARVLEASVEGPGVFPGEVRLGHRPARHPAHSPGAEGSYVTGYVHGSADGTSPPSGPLPGCGGRAPLGERSAAFPAGASVPTRWQRTLQERRHVCVPAGSRMRPPRTCSVASRELWCSRNVVPALKTTTVWRSARSCPVHGVRAWAVVRRPRMFHFGPEPRPPATSYPPTTPFPYALLARCWCVKRGTERTPDP
jgi:hypothetical protein